jgi:hypothetical protein
MKAEHFGSNSDQYTNQGYIWEIAERYNKQSKEENHGLQTARNFKKVESYRRVGIL